MPFFGYTDVDEYYQAMSLSTPLTKARHVAIPLLAVHACDDPIVDSTTYDTAIGCGNDNLWFLITRHGGHIGWPEGTSPRRHGWRYMREVAWEFSAACLAADDECEPSDSEAVPVASAKARRGAVPAAERRLSKSPARKR